MRISPRPLAAVIVFLVYLAFFYGVWIATSVEYNDIGDAVDTLLKWYVAPTWIGGLFLIIAVSWLGWWRPVLFEKNRAPRWVLIAPLFMLALVIVFLFFSDYSGLAAGMIPVLILGSIGVGFSEEVVSRGVIVTGFRSRFTEPWVWFWSCFLFAILHLAQLVLRPRTLSCWPGPARLRRWLHPLPPTPRIRHALVGDRAARGLGLRNDRRRSAVGPHRSAVHQCSPRVRGRSGNAATGAWPAHRASRRPGRRIRIGERDLEHLSQRLSPPTPLTSFTDTGQRT